METFSMENQKTINCIQNIKGIESIQFLRGNTNYTSLIYQNGREKMIAHTLKRFEESSIFEGWCRIHRAYLVNPKYIKSISYKELSLALESGIKLPISRRKLLNFKEL
jgi:DNA-binding LytR/AlgR family response regulator